MDIALTGSSGFIGKSLLEYLDNNITKVSQPTNMYRDANALRQHLLSQISGIKTIIHSAGLAHNRQSINAEDEAFINQSNVDFPIALAEAAAEQGAAQFIFLSSAHVYGQSAPFPVNESSQTHPNNSYANSKLKAEQALLEIAKESTMRVIILRMPLVYGAGVKANFRTLLMLAKSGLPLPLGGCTAKRSYVFSGNLCSAIQRIILSDIPSGIYNIADREASAAPELIQSLSAMMHTKTKLFSVPDVILKSGLSCIGQKNIFNALSEPLLLDTSKLEKTLDWSPAFTQRQGLQQTVDWFLASRTS